MVSVPPHGRQPVGSALLAEPDLLRPDAGGAVARAAVRGHGDLRALREPHPAGRDDRAPQQVGHTEEARDEGCGRPLVELDRGPELLDPAPVHHRDRVGHRHRLLLVVRHVHEGQAEIVLQRLQLELQLLPQLEVERAERLVEEQHARRVDQRTGERDALLLAARELPRLALLEALEADPPQDLDDAAAQLIAFDPAPPEPEGDVLEDGQVREERVALEDSVDIPAVRRQPDDVAAAQLDAPGVGLLEAADHAQRRRLAAAGGAEQREERARGDLQRHSVDGNDVVETLHDALQTDVDLAQASFTAMCLIRVYSSIE
jgi:hypothetical protein